ncbi:radical SAM protein [Candidatus Falkowbacteria bacterium]|nr:radical SAM protein [Candidatus Falkowbacteria bacterium]
MIILRPDNDGGVIFNSQNGTQVWLDGAGFILALKLARKEKLSEKENEFAIKVRNELGLSKDEPIKIIKPSPFTMKARSFRQLAIPALVDLQITELCNLACPHCYAESGRTGKHLPLSEMLPLFKECSELGVLEVALGGGEPTLHPEFEEILKTIADLDMVPNLATNGRAMTLKTARLIKKYAGAVALSVEFIGDKFKKRRGFEFTDWLKAVAKLKAVGVRLVFQLTVSSSNIDELPEVVDYLIGLKPYAIIFLTYKPAGRGKQFDAPLATLDFSHVKKQLRKVFAMSNGKVKFGYDCCMGQGLVGWGLAGDEEIEGCSALRSSLAIDVDLNLYPCSFSAIPVGNLRNNTMMELWSSDKAEFFRNNFEQNRKKQGCKDCSYGSRCLGGCPEFKLLGCYKKTGAE